MSVLINKIRKRLFEEKYAIGFINNDQLNNDNFFNYINWVDLGDYKKGWFADPFILSMSEKYIKVLAEEYLYKTRLGRISLLTIERRNYKLISVDVVLQLPTHLSFPNFLIENNNIYVYPENYQSGGVTIYEYDAEKKCLVNGTKIIDSPLVDTQIVKVNDTYYAFGVENTTGTAKDCKVLKIFKSVSLCGTYKSCGTIENQSCNERGAGKIFIHGSNIIRPAQCCEGDYGKNIIFYKMNIESNGFEEQTVYELRPNNFKYMGRGLHTFNQMDNLTVIDGRDCRYKVAGFIKKIFNK